MNRRDFLKKIGVASVAVAAVPAILISAETTVQVVADKTILGTGVREQMEASNKYYYHTELSIEKLEEMLYR